MCELPALFRNVITQVVAEATAALALDEYVLLYLG
jgi:hypothetical protein